MDKERGFCGGGGLKNPKRLRAGARRALFSRPAIVLAPIPQNG